MSVNNLSEDEIRSMLAGSEENGATIRQAKFLPLKEVSPDSKSQGIAFLGEVMVKLSVELGETIKTVGEILQLEAGTVLPVDRLAGEHVDISVNGVRFASGEVVVINEVLGVRINSLNNSGE